VTVLDPQNLSFTGVAGLSANSKQLAGEAKIGLLAGKLWLV
jgi:hypothetical protein